MRVSPSSESQAQARVSFVRAQGVPMITVKGLATVLSGANEEPEQANLHGVRYSDGYQKVVDPG